MNTDKNNTDKRGFRQTGLAFTFAHFVLCAMAKHHSRLKYSDLLNLLFLSVFIRVHPWFQSPISVYLCSSVDAIVFVSERRECYI
jgi:hypothetical protein